jgi:hypothetical protein
VGVPSRACNPTTLEQWNLWDNSHYQVEIYRNDLNKWVLYDIDANVFFNANGAPLSFIEFCDAIAQKTSYNIKWLATDVGYDLRDTNYIFLWERMTTESNLRAWYYRIMQVPIIDVVYTKYFTCDSADIARILTIPGTVYLDRSDFMLKFYSAVF